MFFAIRYYNNWQNTSLEPVVFETTQKLDELMQLSLDNHLITNNQFKIVVADLMYIKATNSKLEYHLFNGDLYRINGNLETVIKKLPLNFIHYPNKYLINSNFIKKTTNANIILTGNTTLSIKT